MGGGGGEGRETSSQQEKARNYPLAQPKKSSILTRGRDGGAAKNVKDGILSQAL